MVIKFSQIANALCNNINTFDFSLIKYFILKKIFSQSLRHYLSILDSLDLNFNIKTSADPLKLIFNYISYKALNKSTYQFSLGHSSRTIDYIYNNIGFKNNDSLLSEYDYFSFENTTIVHVRGGDYPSGKKSLFCTS